MNYCSFQTAKTLYALPLNNKHSLTLQHTVSLHHTPQRLALVYTVVSSAKQKRNKSLILSNDVVTAPLSLIHQTLLSDL